VLPEVARLEGVYRSHDPWDPVLRVFSRAGRLYLWSAGEDDELALTEVEEGSWAAGDVALPRRLRFLGDPAGVAVVLELNGGRWYRSNEE
jgi:hypothetical protein